MDNIFKEFYKRFFIPFYIPILSLLPLLLIIISKESSQYQKLRLITFFIGLFIVIFSEITIKFISNSSIQNLSIIVLPIILILFLYLYFFIKFKTSNIK